MKRKMSRRQFIASTTVAGGAAFFSKQLFAAPFQDPVLNTTMKDGKPVSHERVSWKVQPFPMKQVRLGEGPCKQAMEADRQYLHSLPPDRLLHTFRINAGFPPRRSRWADGRHPTANCAATTPAAIIFPLRPDVRQHRETKSSKATATRWSPNWPSARMR